jgi:Phage integrase family
VRVPRHEPGPPETLTDTDYANLLRVPDRRTLAGKRDCCGRSATAGFAPRSSEASARVICAVPVRTRGITGCSCAARAAASARSPCRWRCSRRSRRGSRSTPSPAGSDYSTSTPYSSRSASTDTKSRSPSRPAGCTGSCAQLRGRVPERLSHPHALRAYWATHCLEAGVPVHTVSARLGHVDLRTTARYAAPRPEQVDDIADVLDRRHQAARRAGETM